MEATSNVDVQGDAGQKITIWKAIVPVIVRRKNFK